MKSCIQCGAEAEDDVSTCTSCGRAFAYVAAKKKCLNCDTEAPIDQSECEICRRATSWQNVYQGSGTLITSNAIARNLSARPDGSTAKTVGVVFGLAGILAALISFTISTTQYSFGGEIDPSKVAMRGTLLLIGGGFIQLGVIIWLVGYIVSAISFLPGKDEQA